MHSTAPPADLRPLMTASQVATLLAVSLRRFEQMVAAQSAPPHLRIGRLRRWQQHAVEHWLMQQAAGAKTQAGEPPVLSRIDGKEERGGKQTR